MTIKNDLQKIKTYLDFITLQAWHDDKISVKTDFAYIVDCLQKDDCISEKTSNNAYLYENKKGHVILTCNSYKLQVV